MKTKVVLLGTQLFLNEGQEVKLQRATNQPKREDGQAQYFAQPLNGHWGADSILVTESEVATLQQTANNQ